ncbi:MAG: ATP-grasp domain-containing protein [Labilithrix sp.]|nr:ATP-grasp domain-containing protein [Labilithrix sp.]
MRIGIAFNLKRLKPRAGGAQDDEAEYDAPSTIEAIAEAIASFGHDVILLEADATFPAALLGARADVVFNVSEGARGRSREAHVPAVLELLGIPYTGSDPASLVTTLDKAVAKAIVRDAGVRTPSGVVMVTGDEPLPASLAFPAIVKPVAEGSSKGVLPASVATSEDEARTLARRVAARYAQGALVEEYLPGREFTVAVLGETVLPPMEIVLRTGDPFPVYSFDHKLEPTDEVTYEAPAQIPSELDREIRDLAARSFAALGCRDVARIDVRLDAAGHPAFIECNPLPGLTPGWSDLCLISEAAGVDYATLIGRILEPALRRARRATFPPREAVHLSL